MFWIQRNMVVKSPATMFQSTRVVPLSQAVTARSNEPIRVQWFVRERKSFGTNVVLALGMVNVQIHRILRLASKETTCIL